MKYAGVPVRETGRCRRISEKRKPLSSDNVVVPLPAARWRRERTTEALFLRKPSRKPLALEDVQLLLLSVSFFLP